MTKRSWFIVISIAAIIVGVIIQQLYPLSLWSRVISIIFTATGLVFTIFPLYNIFFTKDSGTLSSNTRVTSLSNSTPPMTRKPLIASPTPRPPQRIPQRRASRIFISEPVTIKSPVSTPRRLLDVIGSPPVLVSILVTIFLIGILVLFQATKPNPRVTLIFFNMNNTQSVSQSSQSSTHQFYAVAWSPDGKSIACASSDNSVQVWNASTGGNLLIYHGHTSPVYSLAWSPDGKRIASGSADKTVQVWDVADGVKVYTYSGHHDSVNAVVWSPDDKRIASGSEDKTVQVWDAYTGTNPIIYRGHSSAVEAVAWSPDGTRIASGSSDNTVRIWDAFTGGRNVTINYNGHSDTVYAVAWSSDGRRIASASSDGTVQIWNTATGSHILTYPRHSGFFSLPGQLALHQSHQRKYLLNYGHNALFLRKQGILTDMLKGTL
jgi:WD40 repeat protein